MWDQDEHSESRVNFLTRDINNILSSDEGSRRYVNSHRRYSLSVSLYVLLQDLATA